MTRTCGGLRSMRARSDGVRVAGAHGGSDSAAASRRCAAQLEQFAERHFEILANVVRERFQRRDVDDERFVGERVVRARGA